MYIQNITNNQYNFTGIKFYNADGLVSNFKSSPFWKNKAMAEIDRELDKIHFDVKVTRDNKGDYIASVVEQGKNVPNVNLLPRLAKISDKDERVVCYPVGNNKTYDVMYEEIGADAESRAWEYNFGDRTLGQLQAALDIAKRISRGY